MKNNHECKETFKTRKIDECSGEGYNRCFGINPMVLEIWFEGKEGTECYYDDWIETQVKYCPFCGLKSEQVEKVEWIKCTDRLPDKRVLVLVFDPVEYFIDIGSIYDFKGEISWDLSLSECRNVSHWMPLPKPPEEELIKWKSTKEEPPQHNEVYQVTKNILNCEGSGFCEYDGKGFNHNGNYLDMPYWRDYP